jgi:hypothetical protein
MAREYPEVKEGEVLCEKCPFNVQVRTPEPPESDKGILEQIDDLRVDYCTLNQIPNPQDRQEQVMLIMGYNKALTDVAKLIVRGIPPIVEKMDGTCLDDEADRERFIKALYGARDTNS